MKIAFIGLPRAGKSTLWNALTGEVSGTGYGMSHTQEPPCRPIRWATEALAHDIPENCRIELIDTPPLYRGAVEEQAECADVLSECDALVQVLRLFTRGWLETQGVLARPKPAEEVDIVDGELLALDLRRVINRLDRWDAQERLSREEEQQREALMALLPALEGGQFIREMGLRAGEILELTGFRLVTALPILYVANVDEEVFLGELGERVPEELEERLSARNSPLLPVCARLEADAAVLASGEGEEFLYEQGIRYSAAQRLLRELNRLGLPRRH